MKDACKLNNVNCFVETKNIEFKMPIPNLFSNTEIRDLVCVHAKKYQKDRYLHRGQKYGVNENKC